MYIKHLMSFTPTYTSWRSMLKRCKFRKGYKGKIFVCERWRVSFLNFLSDMGERPEGKTLDRIDPHGDYEPSNCRWATNDEQQKNKRNNRMLSLGEETHCVAEWSRRTGIKSITIHARLRAGWPVDRVLRP